MKVGIISDTHDDLDSVRQAVLLFKMENVDLVIHAGDYVYPGVVDKFADLPNARLIGVLGNNDGEKIGLFQRFSKIGGELKGDFCEMDFDGLKFGIYHGTSSYLTEAAIISGEMTYSYMGIPISSEGKQKEIRSSLILALLTEIFQI